MTNQEIDTLHDALNALIEMELYLAAVKAKQKNLVEIIDKLAKKQHRKGTKPKSNLVQLFAPE